MYLYQSTPVNSVERAIEAEDNLDRPIGGGYCTINNNDTSISFTKVLDSSVSKEIDLQVRAKKGLSDSLSFVSRSLSRRFSRPIVSNVSGPSVDMNEHVVHKAVKVVESTTVKDSNRILWSDQTTENQAHESFQSNNSMPSAGLDTVDDDDDDDDKNDTISINDDDQVKVMPEAA